MRIAASLAAPVPSSFTIESDAIAHRSRPNRSFCISITAHAWRRWFSIALKGVWRSISAEVPHMGLINIGRSDVT